MTATDALAAHWRQNADRGLLVMGTGLGKTVVAAHDLRTRLQYSPGPVLVLAHQTYILGQLEQTFRSILGNTYSYGRFHGEKPKVMGDITFASLQAMFANKSMFRRDKFAHLIVDEGHHAAAKTFRATIDYFTPRTLLGMTATPVRHDRKSIFDIFGPAVHTLAMEDAVCDGHLTPIRYVLPVRSGGITSPNQLRYIRKLERPLIESLDEQEIIRMITNYAEPLGNNLRMMVFCRSTDEADEYARQLPGVYALHSKLKRKIQRTRSDGFRAGDIKGLTSVTKLNEGVDYPATNLIVLLRQHGSLPALLQQIGRALRLSKGKREVIVLDLAANLALLESALNMEALAGKTRFTLELDSSLVTARKTNGSAIGMRDKPEFEGDLAAHCFERLHALTRELGRIPTPAEVNADGQLPYFGVIVNLFDAKWEIIVKELGLDELATSL